MNQLPKYVASTSRKRSQLKYDLIDELHLMTFPLIAGEGKRLFKENSDQKMFNLKEIRSTEAGVLIARYTPDK